MNTETITIHVTPEAARVYETASDKQKRKIDALLSLHVMELARSDETLEDVMREISRKAQSRGLTPEILQSILDES